ncbi:hypothetical protein H0H81_010361, partial [Sphagnurus paluster]
MPLDSLPPPSPLIPTVLTKGKRGGKRKAPSPAESTRSAPSRPSTPPPNFFNKPCAALIPDPPDATIPPPKDFSFAMAPPFQVASPTPSPAALYAEITKMID